MKLKDGTLFREQAWVGGAWTDADDGSLTEVNNPASGGRLGAVPELSATQARAAIEAAEAAWPEWRARTAKARGQILRRWSELMLANREDLARIMTAEQGKPLAEAEGEIAYAASFLEWYAEEGRRVYGETIPAHRPDTRILVLRQPVGVVATITPWNFPAAMITRKVGPALAAGCTVVSKPAEQTPFSALALAELGQRAGLPPGVFNVVTGDARRIGEEFTSNPVVRKLSFTGSTEVGKLLIAQCAQTVKKVSMELGGNAPFIVFDDADLDEAVAGAMACKFRNTGQTCVCANRILVQDGIFEAFARRLSEEAGKLVVGDGLLGETHQGPLIDTAALEKVEAHIEDALSRGARLLVGGQRHVLGGTFFQPTVLADVTSSMCISREETFGPVAPLFRFSSDEEAIHLANETPFGLAAYFYTRDLRRAWRISEALEYGIVGLNTGIISTEVAPFGGMKESGLGREGSHHGIDEYLETKYVAIGGLHA